MMMTFSGNLELAEIHGVKPPWVDMHSHLLPAFDDGARNIEESLSIIHEIKHNGAKALFWTPHLKLNSFPDINEACIVEHYGTFVDIIQNKTGIALFCGSELFCSPPLPERLVPLGKSDFVLIEFPLDVYPSYLLDVIYNIQLAGYRVIIAHVERYRWLFPKKKKFLKQSIDYSLVDELKNKGVYFQINYQVLLNTAQYQYLLPLLKDNKVEFIGSDKHHTDDKRPVIDFSKLKDMDF